MSLCFEGDKPSFLRQSSWIGEGACSDLIKLGITWCTLYTGALRLFALCLHLNSVLVERSECRDLFGVPLFTRLSKTLFSGCLEGVTNAATCQSYILIFNIWASLLRLNVDISGVFNFLKSQSMSGLKYRNWNSLNSQKAEREEGDSLIKAHLHWHKTTAFVVQQSLYFS